MFEMLVNTRYATGSIVDWISGQLYWSDSFSKRIMTAKLDARYPAMFYQGEKMAKITSIAIDPIGVNSFTNAPTLFVSGETEIYFIDLMNKVIKQVHKADCKIRNIVFDSRENRLCWSCTEWEIRCSRARENYNFVRPTEIYSDIGGLSPFGDVWLWTSTNVGVRIGRGKLGNKTLKLQSVSDHNLQGIAEESVLFSNYMQPESKSGVFCHHLRRGSTCSCGIGFQLQTDQRTCKPGKWPYN